MSIKIIANNIELDFVKETLSIKKENNALNRDFKVSHSSIPFLIIENANTKKAIGTRELASVKKSKTVEVIVFEGGMKYMGELQILSYLNGFRKCNLKYSSSLLTIMNKKISEFMPVVSVIPGETNPVPFSEKSKIPVAGSDYWSTYPDGFIDQSFPAVKWQFPKMKYANKFGENLPYPDTWFFYMGFINNYDEIGFIENSYVISSGICEVRNKNVAAPQLYLLAPLYYALQSVGFSMGGSFVNSEFIKRLLIYSPKNNLTQTYVSKESGVFTFPALNFTTLYDEFGAVIYSYYFSENEIVTTIAGVYTFEYEFEESDFDFDASLIGEVSFQIYLFGGDIYNIFLHTSFSGSQTYKGSISIYVSPDQVGDTIFIKYYSPKNTVSPYSITKNVHYNEEYFQMHPTIQLGRYAPDWTFATYLNALQNLFNLEINIDDLAKKMTLEFNEETISNGSKVVLNKSLALESYEESPANAFLLKYENSDDAALWITKEGVEKYGSQTSDFLDKLESKFKYIPTSFTADLSDEIESKSGIGLMIYDPVYGPFTATNYLGQTLKIEGANGIYEVFWRKFIKFLANGSPVEMSGPFTESELNKIINLKRIFVDNQEYIIANMEYSETQKDNFELKFRLKSVTF
jgi:hypothetical protein